MSIYSHLFTNQEIDELNALPEVIRAKAALQNDDVRMNYGIYANGLLVETCSLHFLTNHSNMTLLE